MFGSHTLLNEGEGSIPPQLSFNVMRSAHARNSQASCSPAHRDGTGKTGEPMTQTELNVVLPEPAATSRAVQNPQTLHRALAQFGKQRLSPALPSSAWRSDLARGVELVQLEGELVDAERAKVAPWVARAPRTPTDFIAWFRDLREQGPGQHDPLFDWLAREADREQLRWFVQQELAGEAGFDDLVALTQLRMPCRPKLEMARNYWDEMGRGKPAGMHGPMLGRLAEELRVDALAGEGLVWEALCLGNIMVAFACNRRYAYQSVGALGAIELTAPTRAVKVAEGLERVGVTGDASYYFRLHSTLDIQHAEEWTKEVIAPLVEADPRVLPCIAEGALVRLNAGARCFDRYRAHFGLGGSRAELG
jgi:hypothetical protein